MKDIKEIYPQIKDGKWQVFNKFESDDEKFYQLHLLKDDTIYNLNMFVYSKSYMKEFNRKNKYDIELCKAFKDSVYKYEILMRNFDTIYHFKIPVKSKTDKYYYKGKYRSLFKEGKLNSCQTRYYIKHKDSLNQIKGNNLPELPCLDK